MKKTFTTLLALLTAFVLLLSLVSCDQSGRIKNAFEDKGYRVETLTADNNNVKVMLSLFFSEEQQAQLKDYEFIYVSMDGILNIAKKAAIIKFPSEGKLKEFYKDNVGLEQFEELKKDGTINGNCIIITLNDDCKTIFKEA